MSVVLSARHMYHGVASNAGYSSLGNKKEGQFLLGADVVGWAALAPATW